MLGRPQGRPFFVPPLMQSGDTFSAKAPQRLRQVNQRVAGPGERRHNLGKIEAVCHNVAIFIGTRSRQSIGSDRIEGGKAVMSRIAGALVRAILVAVMIVTPSILLVDVTTDTQQMVALVAIFAAGLTFVEYNAVYPGLVEFRDAKPFNRLRFLMLFGTVFLLSVTERGRVEPTTLTDLVEAVGSLIGASMDFPYSPVRLARLMMADGANDAQVHAVRTAAGMAYLTSLISLAIFVMMLRAGAWPRAGVAFNVWVNLPTFEPSAGGDVVDRLNRDARINVALGFLLPFLIPAVVSLSSSGFQPLQLTSSQTLIWTMTAWAFLPASLFMRGIALGRIAGMIREKRREGVLADGSLLHA